MTTHVITTTLLLPLTTGPSFTPTTSELPNPTNTDLIFASDTDPVYYTAVQVTNAISTGACLLVIVSYIFLRWKHPRLMTRTSLKLSLAMACTDLIFHCANLAGYGQLPDGILCAFVGGWLFAFGSMLSLFYAAAIALNTQLVFVHGRTPRDNKQIYFLIVPIIVAFTICTPALIAGVYGYDQAFDYCWYETRGLDDRVVIIRMVFTYNLWLCLTLLYLVVAAILITWSIFHPRHPLAARPIQVVHNPKNTAHNQSHNTANVMSASLAATLARRDLARRALTLRLLGYILVPTICVISGMVLDLLGESKSGANIPAAVTNIVSALAGLMGTLNAILFSFDPSVLAVIHALRLERRRRQQAAPKHEGFGPRGNSRVFGSDRERRVVGVPNTGAMNTNGVLVVTTVDLDTHLEAGRGHSFWEEDHERYCPGPHADTETIDEGYRRSMSTIGYHVDEILETYRGL